MFIGALFSRRFGSAMRWRNRAMCRHPSQLYEAGLEGFLLLIVLVYIALKGGFKSPGLLTGVFALGYGASRFLWNILGSQIYNSFQNQPIWICFHLRSTLVSQWVNLYHYL